jgi:hypothetical protein
MGKPFQEALLENIESYCSALRGKKNGKKSANSGWDKLTNKSYNI